MKCTAYPFDSLPEYKYATVVTRQEGRWLMCRERGRGSWEFPGGHIEPGETPMAAARRELYEETGATDYDLYPLCDYWASDEPHEQYPVTWANGQVYIARVRAAGALPAGSEMAETDLFDDLPQALTYPDIFRALEPWIQGWMHLSGEAGGVKPKSE